MSLLDARNEIVDALGEIEDVNAKHSQPATVQPGDAWPRVREVGRGEQGYLMVDWDVLVILPADEVVAYQRLQDLIPDLFDALKPVGYVQSIAPVSFQQQNGPTYPAAQVTFIREF
jgi:hypothetical protein